MNKKNSKNTPSTGKAVPAETLSKQNANTSSNASAFLVLVAGLILGSIVGFVATNQINEANSPNSAKSGGKAGPVKGDEQLPSGHPDISKEDIEKNVQAALAFGQENQDYDSQMKVGMYLYLEAQRLDQAKAFLVKAQELKPDEYEPIVQLGNLAFDTAQEKNKPELMVEAASWYEKALKVKPEDINVRTDYGITFMLRQPPQYDKALEQYDAVLEKEPKHAPTLFNKARALMGKKDFTAAEEIYAKLKEVSPQPELVTALRTELDKAQGKESSVDGGQQKIPTH